MSLFFIGNLTMLLGALGFAYGLESGKGSSYLWLGLCTGGLIGLLAYLCFGNILESLSRKSGSNDRPAGSTLKFVYILSFIVIPLCAFFGCQLMWLIARNL